MVLLNVLHKVVQTFESAVYGILQSKCTYSTVFLIAINKGKVIAFFFSKKSPLTSSVQIQNWDTLEYAKVFSLAAKLLNFSALDKLASLSLT